MAFGDPDASTPAFAQVNTNFTTTGATCGSFTPPADSLVRLAVFADTSAVANPGTETVTDSVAGATGWTFQGRRSKPDAGSQAGSVALFTKYYAVSPGAITVTVVGNATGANAGGFSAKVVAGCTGVEGFDEGSNTAAVMSTTVTTVTANVRCEMAGTDWNVQAAPTAGAGQTAVLSSAVGAGPDTRVYVGVQNAVTATPGTVVTMSTASPSTGNANNFIAWALVPSAGAPAGVPYSLQRAIQPRDAGEAQWLQRDRRDANTVASAISTLPAPLDVAYGAGGSIWHQRGGAADAASRNWQPQQRTYPDPTLLTPAVAMPSPPPIRTVPVRDYGEAQWLQRPARVQITTALLENELLGNAEWITRVTSPVTNAPRWWMPQQPRREGLTPGLLDSAELEGPLLAGDLHRHGHAAIYTDRRDVPQQRAYISDPSFYPTTAATDPLTLAFGAGGVYWLLYNMAALQVDRREVAQQRRYQSDPGLLATALLEGVLLGGGDAARHAFFLTDRRAVPQQPVRVGFASDVPADPLLLDGGPRFRTTLAATHADRRETVAQRIALLFVGVDAPPTVKATSTASVTAIRTSAAVASARRTSTASVTPGGTSSTSVNAGRTSTAAITAKRTSSGGVT